MSDVALVGKIGALLSKLIGEKEFEDILSQESVNSIAVYLRENTVYSFFIPNMEDIHRRDLEAAINRRFYYELKRLENYLTYPKKKIVELVIERCKIETAKKLLRSAILGESVEERFLACEMGFDKDVLSLSSVEEVLEIFKEEPLHSVLKSAVSSYKETGSIGGMENFLDFWYFSTLNKILKLFSTRGVLIFFKKQVDLINAMWVYRARVIFRYTPERAVSLTLPFGYHLKRSDLKRLAEVSSREEFFKIMEGTPYGEVFRERGDLPEEYLLERRMDRFLYREAKKLVRSRNGFDKLVGFMHLLEYEMKDLVTAIELVRYKAPLERARSYLIRGGMLNA